MMKVLIAASLALLMTGCLFVVDSKQNTAREQWSSHEADRIVIGQTTGDWLRQTFGPPDRRSTYDDGTELWRYRNHNTTESRVALFLLFRVNVERDHSETLTIELRDGVVTDHWVERR